MGLLLKTTRRRFLPAGEALIPEREKNRSFQRIPSEPCHGLHSPFQLSGFLKKFTVTRESSWILRHGRAARKKSWACPGVPINFINEVNAWIKKRFLNE